MIYLIRNKITKKSISTILPSIGLFFIILLPMMIFRIDTVGTDGIFIRTATQLVETSQITNDYGYSRISKVLKYFLNI